MGVAVVETAIGPCSLSYNERGLLRIELPEPLPRRASRDAVRGDDAAPHPPWLDDAIARLRAHLDGESVDLAALPIDIEASPPFFRQVYEAARHIGPGQTMSYGELARTVGRPAAARAIGQAMAKNPLPIVVPCHRVVARGGIGGFSAPGGITLKERLLALERADVGGSLPLFQGAASLSFDARNAVDTLCAADPVLGAHIARIGPFALRLEATHDTFAALGEAIVYQQLNGRAARAIVERLKTALRSPHFPSSERVRRARIDTLRAAGLSRAKAAALHDLAEKTAAGVVPSLHELVSMSDEDITSRLVTVRGIGPWTVEMLLIFRLGRPDVLPASDYGLRKGYAAVFGGELPSPRALLAHGERWRPFRTVASWYLWRAVDAPKEQSKRSWENGAE